MQRILVQCGTCAIEGGHVEHGLLISMLHLFFGDHQLYLIPFLWLEKDRGERSKDVMQGITNNRTNDISELDKAGLTISIH